MKAILPFVVVLAAGVARGEEIPAAAVKLKEIREREMNRLNAAYLQKLGVLLADYRAKGDSKAAAAVEELIAEVEGQGKPAPSSFAGTRWSFQTKAEKIDEIELLPDGKVKSRKYRNATWEAVDKDSIRFQYSEDPGEGYVLFKFQDPARRHMVGAHSSAGTVRNLYKLD